jgi:hypothetical protein
VLLPWRGSIANTDVALLLVVAIVAVAANGHRAAGILAAVSAAVWFDFFWTVPYERFTITRHTDIETTLLLLAVGAAVSELAARGRRARRVVVRDTSYMEALRAARFETGRHLGHPPQLTDDGTLAWGAVRWNLDEHGFPNEDVELLARSGGRAHGRFLLTPVPGTAPSSEARQVALVLSRLVGAVLAGDATPSKLG